MISVNNSQDALAVIVAVVLALVIGFVIGRHPTHSIRNRGEARLARQVMAMFLPPDYHLLNHITLRHNDGTTEIDHILVSRFGIFVIETKDYTGWIFAGAKDPYWTQVLYRAKFKFQNPIRQNYRHLLAVRELMDFLGPEVIHSVVVFTGEAEFRTDVPNGVYSLPEFLAYVDSFKDEIMSLNRVQFCVGRLETARLAITNATDIEHVQELRRRHGIND